MKLTTILPLGIFLFVSSSYAASFILQTNPGVTAKLHINGTTAAIIANAKQPKITFQTSTYSEAIITATKGNITNVCHITFFAHDTWAPIVNLGDHCQFLNKPIDNKIVVRVPSAFSDSIPSSRFESLDKSRVFLLDYNKKTKNMLFRGNQPFTLGFKQKVAFNKLYNHMKMRFKEQLPGKKFPKKIVLIDVSLISGAPYGEAALVTKEYNSFEGQGSIYKYLLNNFYPNLDKEPYKINEDIAGHMLWWPVEPVLLSAYRFNSNVKKVDNALNLTAPIINLANRKIHAADIKPLIYHLLQLMNVKHKIPYAIYIHCKDGINRTAVVSVSYLLHQYGFSLPRAFIYGTTGMRHGHKYRILPPVTLAAYFHSIENTMRWYCLYTQTKDGLPRNCNAYLSLKAIKSSYPWQEHKRN